MIRRWLLTVFSLTFAAQVHAQKAHRAAKAMNELKFEKAFEMFEEVLQKDSNNIVALIGYPKARLKENELTQNPIPLELLQRCYDYLQKSKTIELKESDAKILQEDRLVYNEYSVDSLLIKCSNLIWTNYIKEESSIAKFEFFQANYYKPNSQNPSKLVAYKLDKLYFDSLSKVNTIPAYNFYLEKFDKSRTIKGNASNEVKAKILGLEYNDAFSTTGIEKLTQFITKNKAIVFEGTARIAYEANIKLANKEIEKREYQRALAAPGVTLLETFISKYKTAEQFKAAKDTIELRYYKNAKQTQQLSNYELFLNKYSFSVYRNEVEDTVASMYYRAIVPTRKSDLTSFLTKSAKFHKSTIIQGLVDAVNLKIYYLEYAEASNSSELGSLLTFYKKYSKTTYPDVSLIRNKLFHVWEEAILKSNITNDESGLINFMKEFSDEPATSFNKIIDATKSGLILYAETLKPKLVGNVIKGTQKSENSIYLTISTEKLESLCNSISNRLYFTNLVMAPNIVDNLKLSKFTTTATLIELFNTFFTSCAASNSYIQSINDNNDQGFIFGYQTREKFVTKLLLWDDAEMKYKEIDPAHKDNNLLKLYMMQYGISNMPAYISSLTTKYNYVVIGSKINKDALISLSNTAP